MTRENSKPARERRAVEAALRQKEHDARSVGHQEAILDQRPGASARERARLSKKND